MEAVLFDCQDINKKKNHSIPPDTMHNTFNTSPQDLARQSQWGNSRPTNKPHDVPNEQYLTTGFPHRLRSQSAIFETRTPANMRTNCQPGFPWQHSSPHLPIQGNISGNTIQHAFSRPVHENPHMQHWRNYQPNNHMQHYPRPEQCFQPQPHLNNQSAMMSQSFRPHSLAVFTEMGPITERHPLHRPSRGSPQMQEQPRFTSRPHQNSQSAMMTRSLRPQSFTPSIEKGSANYHLPGPFSGTANMQVQPPFQPRPQMDGQFWMTQSFQPQSFVNTEKGQGSHMLHYPESYRGAPNMQEKSHFQPRHQMDKQFGITQRLRPQSFVTSMEKGQPCSSIQSFSMQELNHRSGIEPTFFRTVQHFVNTCMSFRQEDTTVCHGNPQSPNPSLFRESLEKLNVLHDIEKNGQSTEQPNLRQFNNQDKQNLSSNTTQTWCSFNSRSSTSLMVDNETQIHSTSPSAALDRFEKRSTPSKMVDKRLQICSTSLSPNTALRKGRFDKRSHIHLTRPSANIVLTGGSFDKTSPASMMADKRVPIYATSPVTNTAATDGSFENTFPVMMIADDRLQIHSKSPLANSEPTESSFDKTSPASKMADERPENYSTSPLANSEPTESSFNKTSPASKMADERPQNHSTSPVTNTKPTKCSFDKTSQASVLADERLQIFAISPVTNTAATDGSFDKTYSVMMIADDRLQIHSTSLVGKTAPTKGSFNKTSPATIMAVERPQILSLGQVANTAQKLGTCRFDQPTLIMADKIPQNCAAESPAMKNNSTVITVSDEENENNSEVGTKTKCRTNYIEIQDEPLVVDDSFEVIEVLDTSEILEILDSSGENTSLVVANVDENNEEHLIIIETETQSLYRQEQQSLVTEEPHRLGAKEISKDREDRPERLTNFCEAKDPNLEKEISRKINGQDEEPIECVLRADFGDLHITEKTSKDCSNETSSNSNENRKDIYDCTLQGSQDGGGSDITENQNVESNVAVEMTEDFCLQDVYSKAEVISESKCVEVVPEKEKDYQNTHTHFDYHDVVLALLDQLIDVICINSENEIIKTRLTNYEVNSYATSVEKETNSSSRNVPEDTPHEISEKEKHTNKVMSTDLEAISVSSKNIYAALEQSNDEIVELGPNHDGSDIATLSNPGVDCKLEKQISNSSVMSKRVMNAPSISNVPVMPESVDELSEKLAQADLSADKIVTKLPSLEKSKLEQSKTETLDAVERVCPYNECLVEGVREEKKSEMDCGKETCENLAELSLISKTVADPEKDAMANNEVHSINSKIKGPCCSLTTVKRKAPKNVDTCIYLPTHRRQNMSADDKSDSSFDEFDELVVVDEWKDNASSDNSGLSEKSLENNREAVPKSFDENGYGYCLQEEKSRNDRLSVLEAISKNKASEILYDDVNKEILSRCDTNISGCIENIRPSENNIRYDEYVTNLTKNVNDISVEGPNINKEKTKENFAYADFDEAKLDMASKSLKAEKLKHDEGNQANAAAKMRSSSVASLISDNGTDKSEPVHQTEVTVLEDEDESATTENSIRKKTLSDRFSSIQSNLSYDLGGGMNDESEDMNMDTDETESAVNGSMKLTLSEKFAQLTKDAKLNLQAKFAQLTKSKCKEPENADKPESATALNFDQHEQGNISDSPFVTDAEDVLTNEGAGLVGEQKEADEEVQVSETSIHSTRSSISSLLDQSEGEEDEEEDDDDDLLTNIPTFLGSKDTNLLASPSPSVYSSPVKSSSQPPTPKKEVPHVKTKSGLTLDQLLEDHESNAENERYISDVNKDLQKGLADGGFLKILTREEEASVDCIPEEHRLLLERFSGEDTGIPECRPGELVFEPQFYQQLFDPNLHPSHCGFTVGSGSMTDRLVVNIKPTHYCHIVSPSICLCFQKITDKTALLRWFFFILSCHEDPQVTHGCETCLLDLMSSGQVKWVPSVADILAVLINYGASMENLVPAEECDNLRQELILQPDRTPSPREGGYNPEQLVAVLKMLANLLNFYSETIPGKDLYLLLQILSKVSLDERLTDFYGRDVIICCVQAVLRKFSESDWQTFRLVICRHIPTVSSHHHNQASLVQLLPITQRGAYIQKRASYIILNHILLDKSDIPDDQLDTFQVKDLYELVTPMKDLLHKDPYTMSSICSMLDYCVGHNLTDADMEQLKYLMRKVREIPVKENVRFLNRTRVKDMLIRMTSHWALDVKEMKRKQMKIFENGTLDSPVKMKMERIEVNQSDDRESSDSQSDDEDGEVPRKIQKLYSDEED